MGGFGHRRAEKCVQPQATYAELVTPPPAPCLNLPIVSPLSAEKPFETSPLKGMTLTSGGPPADAAKFHGETMLVTLPVDAQPSFLYHGRTKSYYAAGTGVAELSRNNKGLTFDPGDTAVADGCTEVRRTLVQTKDGPAYQYQISFKKTVAGDEYQTGAMDPGKMAIRVNGKEYDLSSQSKTPGGPTPTPMMTQPQPPGTTPIPGPMGGNPMGIPLPLAPAPSPSPRPKDKEEQFPSLPKSDGPKTKSPGSDSFPDKLPGDGPKGEPKFPKISPGGPK